MNIVVIGSADRAAECRLKFGEHHNWRVFAGTAPAFDQRSDVILDFVTPTDADQIKHYPANGSSLVLFDTTVVRLSGIVGQGKLGKEWVFGFCGLPTFVQREVLEVSKLPESQVDLLSSACENLGTAFELVADVPGLVSPRVICMIINEAFYALEEGIATREDIDLAMKLGTNYPFGPFEWSERIGLSNVVRVLNAAYKDSGDDRYRVCALLSRLA